jgi:large subunit ribosomal protein L25
MAEAIKISAANRAVKGSNAGRRLRRQGVFPGVVYSAGKPGRNIQVSEHEFRKSLQGHHSEHILMDLEIEGGEALKVMLQDVQHNSLTGQIMHADFHEVSMTEKLRVEVMIELTGTPVGVSMGGGVLEHLAREVEVECLPGDLMETIKVDVSGLAVGDSLTVSDIQLDASKYHIITDGDVAVAMVASPTVEVAATPAEGGAAEPEVLTAKKTEEAK